MRIYNKEIKVIASTGVICPDDMEFSVRDYKEVKVSREKAKEIIPGENEPII